MSKRQKSGNRKPEPAPATARPSGTAGGEPAVSGTAAGYGRVFMNFPAAIILLDRQRLCIEDANSAALTLFGYARDAFLSLTFADISSDPATAAPRLSGSGTSETVRIPLHRFRKKDGSVIAGAMHIRAVASDDGRRKLIVCVDDTTRRLDAEGALKKAEEDLKISQELLHQAQKMEALGTLVSGVAHEINNPINLIMYSMPILRKVWRDFLPLLGQMAEVDPEKTFGGLTYDYLETNLGQILSDAELAADRITKIVADLKNFAKQTNTEDTAPVQLNHAVENAMRLAQTTIRKSRVDLDVDLEADIPLLQGNPQSIEQIVLNLTINAIQAIDHARGRIRVATGYDPVADALVLTVTDNGKGIQPKVADRLFDPFVTDRQAKGGTGLGLSVTYSLVKAHNGRIDFQTALGKGTTFTVGFPLKRKPGKVKILVVDDHDLVRDVLVRALKRHPGYIVDEASDGISACIKLGSFKPNLLVLDIFMPEMSGLEVCRVIKSDAELAELKVIITTGHPGHRLLDEVAELGFKNILIKPIKIRAFLESVEHIFGG